DKVSLFFFSSRRRHTRLVSDWSSDVCSSDLDLELGPDLLQDLSRRTWPGNLWQLRSELLVAALSARTRLITTLDEADEASSPAQIGRASCRGRVESSVVGGTLKREKASGGGR